MAAQEPAWSPTAATAGGRAPRQRRLGLRHARSRIEPANWWYVNKWWEGLAGVPATVRAHEFGHQIGMYDEYPEGACESSRRFANVPNSIMGKRSKVYRRHMQEFHDWFDRKA